MKTTTTKLGAKKTPRRPTRSPTENTRARVHLLMIGQSTPSQVLRAVRGKVSGATVLPACGLWKGATEETTLCITTGTTREIRWLSEYLKGYFSQEAIFHVVLGRGECL